MGLGRRLQSLPPIAVLAIAWFVLLVYAFPGQMTQDSFDHLREARNGIYSDSHPPSINLLWKITDYVMAGPFPMFVLQSTLFLVGIYLLMRRLFAERRAAWITLAIYLFPPVMLPMAVIWKDCFMAGLLALGAAGLLSERRTVKLWALVALVGATAVRYNALGATLPLVVLLFEWRPMGAVRRYALATVTWFAVTFAGFGINAALTDKEMHYWHSSLALYDIVGTLAHVDGVLPDEELTRLLAGTQLLVQKDIHATIRTVYSPRDFFPIINDPQHTMWNVPINGYEPAPESQRDAIERAWKETIRTYPGAYARHRIVVFAEVIGLGERPGAGAVTKREFWSRDMQHEMGLSTGWSKLQRKLTTYMRLVWKHTPIFVQFIYFALAVLLLPLVRRRDILAMLLSGLSMEGTLLFLAHSNDYRYSHWMVVSTIVGAIWLFTVRYRARVPSSV